MSADAKPREKPDEPSAEKPVKKKRSWPRRILRLLVILVAIVILLRLAIPVATPFVLDSVAEGCGLSCDYESLSLGILAGEVELRGLVLTPLEGGEPVARLRLARADIETGSLFDERIVVDRVEVDGFELTLERDETGKWPLLERLASAEQPPEEEPEAEEPKPLSFDAPVEVRAVRVQDVRVTVRDATIPLESRIDLSLSLTDLGATNAPARLEIEVAATEVLEALRIRGEAKTSAKDLEVDLGVRVRGLRPGPVAGYLERFGIRPVADVVEAGFDAQIGATVTGEDSFSASVAVKDVAVTADGAVATRLDALAIDARTIAPTALDVESAVLRGIRWRGEATENGAFRTCGFEFRSPPENQADTTTPTGPATSEPSDPMRITLAKLHVEDVRAELREAAREELLDLRILEIDITGYEAGAGRPLALDARIASPGIVEEIRLQGEVSPFTDVKTVALDLALTGFDPDRFEEMLAASGIETTFDRAGLTGRVTARVETGETLRADVALERLDVRPGEDRLRLARARVAGLALPPESGPIRIASVDVGGLDAAFRRDADGVVEGPGFRLVPAVTKTEEISSSEAPTEKAAPGAPAPRVEIGHLRIADNRLAFRDEAVDPVADLALADFGVDVRDLVLDLAPDATGSPARLHAWISAPGVIEELAVRGSVTATAASVETDVRVAGKGITVASADAYLASAGLASEWTGGDLAAHVKASVRTRGGEMRADLQLEDLSVSDDGIELAGCDGVRVADLVVSPSAVTVDSVRIDRPRARVTRDTRGELHLLGFRLTPVPASSGTGRPIAEVAPGREPPADPPAIGVGEFRLEEASLTLEDRSVTPAVTVIPVLSAEIGRTRFENGQLSTRGSFRIREPKEGMDLRLQTGATASETATHVTLEIHGEGLKKSVLGAYLPPGLEITLREGRLKSRIDATLDTAEGGGRRLLVRVDETRLSDAETPLLSLDSIRVDVPRFDPEHGVVTVDEVSMAGLETSVRRDADGTLRLLGLALPPAAAVEPSVDTPSEPGAPAPRPSLEERLRQAAETALPDVSVRKVDLNVKRLSFTDASAPDPRPLVVENLRLANPKPFVVDGEHPEESPPFVLSLSASAPGLARSLSVETSIGAFLDEPELTLSFALEGLEGSGLSSRAPALSQAVDASALRDARVGFELRGLLRARRRHPLDFDLSKGFGLEMTLKDLALENGDGSRLAGIGEVHVDVTRMDPTSGDVHVKTVEIVGPYGDVTKDEDGIRVMGLLLRERPKDGVPSEGASTASAPTAAAKEAPAGPEIRVDSLYVTGLKSNITDTSVYPPFRMPIEDLVVEVRGFTTKAFTHRRPVTFSTLVRTGAVPSLTEEGKTVSPLEEVALSGRLSFFPRVDGWAKAGISALDLANFSGLAKTAKVDLNGGVLDLGTTVRFRDDGAMDTSTKITLTDLDLSEAPDGPISKILVLPAPLNVVLFVLEDAGGAIDIPLDVRVDEDGVGTGAIVGQSLKVLTALIAEAVATSPFKVLGTAGGILGLGGEEELPSDEPPLVLGFSAGDTMLGREERATLAALIERMDDEDDLAIMLEHEPGRGDLERLHARANPSREDCRDLVSGLRRRKREILRVREQAAADARAAVAAGSDQAIDAARRHLASLDHELGQVETALDRLATLLRPGSERQAQRRTREASVALARIRLAEIRRVLLAAGLENLEARLRVRRPRPKDPEMDGGGRVLIGLTRMAETD